jgi:6-pyruvoyltetrahydropterin/6-carboxytetrahydropterin synthase
MHTAERYHDISCGHRVVGHENKCRHLHGHNYRVHFVCAAQKQCESLDHIGRVIDFTAIKEKLCMWIEDNWDHKFLAWEQDHVMQFASKSMQEMSNGDITQSVIFDSSIVWTPFNPTAENMAKYLVEVIAPMQLEGTGVELISCKIEETMKCSATYHKE